MALRNQIVVSLIEMLKKDLKSTFDMKIICTLYVL